MSVTTRREGNVGYVVIDSALANTLGISVRSGLLEAVSWAEALNLERVIVSGKNGMFAAGADAKEFNSDPVEPHLPAVLNAIEQSYIPWVAAIGGAALACGAQIALACNMRIMAPSASIGFPEVTLGVIPGAGGTQRLPRLVGLANALDMITFGKPMKAQMALDIGLVNALEEDPEYAAFMVNSEELGSFVSVRNLPKPYIDPVVVQAARKLLFNKSCGQTAPLHALDIVERGLSLPFDEGLAIERQAFLDLRSTDQAIALRHVFFTERAAKAPASPISSPVMLDHVAQLVDGFVGNRIHARYREAADTVLMDGSTPWEIDEAMTEFGYAIGPYAAQDLSGLDIAHANRRRQDASRDPARRYIPIADRMVELGKLGRRTGAGWYRYPGGGGRVDDPVVADLAIEEAHFADITRVDYTAGEIRERMLLAMINEAADLLHEGIAQSASDIDLVTVFGYGFPRWRGGLMHYADTLGATSIVTTLERFAKQDPVAWKISPLLKHCAATGRPIADGMGSQSHYNEQ